MNNTSGAYSLFDSATCVIYNERVLNSTKFGNKLNLIHETWSRKFAAYRKPYCSKKKISYNMPPIYAALNRGEHSSPDTSSTFQRWQITQEKTWSVQKINVLFSVQEIDA